MRSLLPELPHQLLQGQLLSSAGADARSRPARSAGACSSFATPFALATAACAALRDSTVWCTWEWLHPLYTWTRTLCFLTHAHDKLAQPITYIHRVLALRNFVKITQLAPAKMPWLPILPPLLLLLGPSARPWVSPAAVPCCCSPIDVLAWVASAAGVVAAEEACAAAAAAAAAGWGEGAGCAVAS